MAFNRNSRGGRKLPLCLKGHAGGPVEDGNYFITLEKGGFALKCWIAVFIELPYLRG